MTDIDNISIDMPIQLVGTIPTTNNWQLYFKWAQFKLFELKDFLHEIVIHGRSFASNQHIPVFFPWDSNDYSMIHFTFLKNSSCSTMPLALAEQNSISPRQVSSHLFPL